MWGGLESGGSVRDDEALYGWEYIRCFIHLYIHILISLYISYLCTFDDFVYLVG